MKAHTSSTPSRRLRIATAALGVAAFYPISAQAVTDTKASTGTDLTVGASWDDTSAPAVADPSIVNWTSAPVASLGAGLTLATATTWYGMNVQGSADTAIGITGAGALTLGSGGIKIESGGVNTTIGKAITLGNVQTWSAASGKTLTVSGIVSGTGPLIIGAASQTSQTFLTSTAQTLFTGVSLSDLIATGGLMGGAYVGGTNNLVSGGYLLSNDGTNANYWLEASDGGFIKGVKTELAQSGGDITARATTARYATGILGYDFNAVSGWTAGTLATADANAGYGGHTTTLITKSSAYGGTVSLGGINTFSGGLIVSGGTLTGSTGVTVNDGQGGSFGTGAITINSGATATTGAAFMIGGNTTTRVVNINGGTLNLQGASTGGEYIRTINMTGGTINNTSGSVYFRTVTAGLSLATLASATTSTISTGIDMTFGNIAVTTENGAAANDLTISGVISQNTGAGSGNKTLGKNGTGTLLLSGNNSYAGGTTVTGGTLTGSTGVAFDGTQAGSFGTGSITVNSGGTLTSTTGFVIGGGQNTTRVLNITGGTVDIKTAGSGGEYFRTINMTGGTILTSDGGSGGSTSDWFRAPNGGITLTTFASATTSTVSTRIDLTLGNLAADVADGGATDDLLITGNITENTGGGSGGRSLTKTGTGMLKLSGANAYTGATNINAGTLALGTTGGIASSASINITPGAIFDISAAGFTLASGKSLVGGRTTSPATDITGNLTSNGTLKPAADGTIGTLTTTGNLTLGGSLNLDLDAASNAGDSITINGTLTISPGLAVNLSNLGVQSGATKTYTVVSGLTSIVDEGNLPALPPNYLWDTLSDPTKLLLVYTNPGANLVWTDSNLNGEWDVGTTSNWDNGSGATIFNDGDLVTFDDTASSGIVNINSSDVLPTTMVFTNTIALDYAIDGSFDIMGSASIAKTGNGLVSILNINSFTGGVLLGDGTLAFASGALGTTGAITMDGGTLRWTTGNTQDLSSRLTMLDGKAAGIDTGANTVTFATAIGTSTTASLVKSGAGTLVLPKASTFTGATTVNAGTLRIDGSTSASSATVLASATLTNLASVQFYRNGTGYTPITSSLTGSGDFYIDGPGGGTMYDHRIVLRGSASDNTGTIHVINTGRLWVDFAGVNAIGDTSIVDVGASAKFYIYQAISETIGGISGTGNVYGGDAPGTSALSVGGGDISATFSGVLQNGGSTLTLTKIGSGTQTLSGINTYTGATTVNAGTLAGSGAAGSNFTIKNTATLSPGAGVGIGTLNTKNLTCESGSTLKFEIDSTTTTADRITASGVVSLTGVTAAFSEIGGGTVAPGTKLVVLDYTGHSLSGTFSGLAEGASVTVGANTYTLSYVDASRVTLTTPIGGYASWKSTNAPTGTSLDDYDNDGVPNGVEYVLGGTKATNDLGKLPKPEIVGSDMTFTFKRDHASKTPDTTVAIEVGTTLSGWPDVYAVPDAAVAINPGVTVIDNSPGEATDTIILTVPMGTDTEKFARLSVIITE